MGEEHEVKVFITVGLNYVSATNTLPNASPGVSRTMEKTEYPSIWPIPLGRRQGHTPGRSPASADQWTQRERETAKQTANSGQKVDLHQP